MSDSKTNVVYSSAGAWPGLPVKEWQDTYATLHMWTQIVGKIRLSQTPLENHWWNSVLYVTSRGLATTPSPHATAVERSATPITRRGTSGAPGAARS